MELTNEKGSLNLSSISYQSQADYSFHLLSLGATFGDVDCYYQVGEIPYVSGWSLHVTAVITQVESVIKLLVPILLESRTAFRIIKNKDLAQALLSGYFGDNRIGRVISIYPKDNENANLLAKAILSVGKELKGPEIPGDTLIKGVLYTRFEQFCGVENEASGHVSVTWPFGEISIPQERKVAFLLNGRYKLIEKIKADAKGIVWKALYMKSFVSVKTCIVKSGKKNMWSDDNDRDIYDRLNWQWELHSSLYGKLNIPNILDCFTEDDTRYLVMEFVKGMPLEELIMKKFRLNRWKNLSLPDRLSLIDLALSIVTIVETLHCLGYVHRDLTPVNFIVDRKGRMFLIDMEMAYSIGKKQPTPPFGMGTQGFMSPEQISQIEPTVFEDVYGLGALFTLFFTGFPIAKFDSLDETLLEGHLSYLASDTLISKMISACLSPDPSKRPRLEEIREAVKRKKEMESSSNTQVKEIFDVSKCSIDLHEFISSAIRGLTCKHMLSSEEIWMSRIYDEQVSFMNAQLSRGYYPNFENGLAGVMYVVAKAKVLGYDIQECVIPYHRSFSFLFENGIRHINDLVPGLLLGSNGVALALDAGIEAGMLEGTTNIYDFVTECFSRFAHGLNIRSGLSGQGLSLLKLGDFVGAEFKDGTLERCLKEIFSNRFSASLSKSRFSTKRKLSGSLNLLAGDIGALYFVLSYVIVFKSDHHRLWLLTRLDELQKQARITVKDCKKVSGVTGKNGNYGLQGELLCLALIFMKAYEAFGKDSYKHLAEEILLTIPESPIIIDYSQLSGLAGLGEVYIEAQRIMGGSQWNYRTQSIIELFYHTKIRTDGGGCYWSIDAYDSIVPGFMAGNSGIIHFLLRAASTTAPINHPIV